MKVVLVFKFVDYISSWLKILYIFCLFRKRLLIFLFLETG